MTMVALPKQSNILTKQTTNFTVKVEKNKSHMNDACDYTKNETIIIEKKVICIQMMIKTFVSKSARKTYISEQKVPATPIPTLSL